MMQDNQNSPKGNCVMKKVLVSFIFVYLLIAGCRSQTTSAPLASLPSPSATPSPMLTPTPGATARYQGTLQANQTQNARYALTQVVKQTEFAQTQAVMTLTPTSTPTVVPSPTVTPSPTLFELPTPPKINTNNYALILPSPDTLIQLDLFNKLPDYDEAVWNQGNILSGSFSDALQFEWGRTFPQNVNQLQQLSDLIRNEEQAYGLYLNSQIQVDILSEYYFQYFNENHVVFVDQEWTSEERVSWNSYLIEIDHDRLPEWLVQVTTRFDLHASFWLTLDQSPDGTYARIPNSIYHKTGFFSVDTDVEVIADLTGDGLSDVILVDHNSGFGSRYRVTFFSIAMSTPNGFEIISDFQEYEDIPSAIISLNYELETSSSNYFPRFHITNVHELPWGCQYETSKDYQWIRGKESVTYADVPEPDTIECSIARAVDPDALPENRDAIRWLNYAYTHGDLSPETQVYVLFRLALMHTLEGEGRSAENSLNLMMELAANEAHPITVALTEQIQPLLEEDQILPYKLCLAAENIALPSSEISYFSFRPYSYPYEGLPDGYPTTLCDTRQIQKEVLQALEFDSSLSPETALRAAGVSVLAVEQVPPSSLGNAWLAIIEDDSADFWYGNEWNDDNKVYILRYFENEGWDMIADFDHPDYLEWVNKDFTGDGVPEVAIAYKYNDPEYTSCELAEDQYEVYIISRVVGEWTVSYFDNEVCLLMNIPFFFGNLIQDKNSDGMVDWVVDHLEEENYDVSLLQTIPPTSPLVLHSLYYGNDLDLLINKTAILADLTDRFFTFPTPSTLRPDLEFYRARWGVGADPTDSQIYAHITYLLALTYELEGDETHAVELFYDIWVNHQDTLYAYLAASRLELK
jgi:hypothetical protein